jgi:archaeosine synthase
MDLITSESIERPEVQRWHKRILERYAPPREIKMAVVLPCSARKPYSKSKSHALFRKSIRRGAREKMGLVHEVILTSPLGLVPRELENVYPAAHYDVPVTGYWSREEKEIAGGLLADYIKKADAAIIAHVDDAYREICKDLDICLTKENILSKASLQDLEDKISSILKDEAPSKIDRRLEEMKKICDFQFGRDASDFLIPEDARVKGYQVFLGTAQLAAINPQTGLISLTLEGGELLKKYGRYIINIDFKPETNSIFCVGVSNAGEEIRPNDEVVVLHNNKVVGVGRATLNGREMTRAKKGLAVRLRHRV